MTPEYAAIQTESSLQANIKALIMQGEFEPGERIRENQLAQRLEAGKAQIRRALAQLAALGIVQIRPRIGTFVFAMQETEFDHFNTVRALLECAAISQAMSVDAPSFIAALRVNLHQAHTLSAQENYRLINAESRLAYRQMDREFHRFAFTIARNRYLSEMYETIDIKIWAMRSLLTFPELNVRTSLDAHTAVVQFLERGAVEPACQRLQEHIRKSFSPQARAMLAAIAERNSRPEGI